MAFASGMVVVGCSTITISPIYTASRFHKACQNPLSPTLLLLRYSWNWLTGSKAVGRDGDGSTLKKCHHVDPISL